MSDRDRKRLVISEEDLADAAPQGSGYSRPTSPMSPAPSLPTVEDLSPNVSAPRGPGAVPSIAASTGAAPFTRTVQGRNLVAAACGIAMGWAFCEITHFGLWTATSALGQDIQIAAYTGAVGFFFAVVYAGWEQLLARNWEGILLAVRRAGPWGFGLAFVSGFIAEIVYRHFVFQILRGLTFGDLVNIAPNAKLYLTRALAWGLFGLGMGVAVAGGLRAKDRVLNGVIGGGIGGAVGGLIFHWASFNISSETWSRFVGLLVVGLGIGLAIGLVEKARRDAWMHIVRGPMAGKEFILYGTRSVLGSSPQCEITLIKDPAIQPFHAIITTSDAAGGTARMLEPYPGCTISVNGGAVSHHRLRSGDRLSLGAMDLVYSECMTNA